MNEDKFLHMCSVCNSEDIGLWVSYDPHTKTTAYYVECNDCGCRTKDFDTKEEATRAWNRREYI